MNERDKIHAWDTLWARMCTYGWIRADYTNELQEACDALSAARASALALKKAEDNGSLIRLFSDEDIAALRILVSTAVWIRSEQLAHPNAILRVHVRDEQAHFTGMSAEVDTHNMHVMKLTGEMQAGQSLYTKLATYCVNHAIPIPEWHK